MFPEYIKKQRLSLCMTQAEFAKKLGTSQAYYCTIEKGKRKPGLKMLRRIAETLGIGTETLRSMM